ncbi:MAG TPA: FCD domain-containing protein [Acetobacteraceae bacterium]|jgi:DNA-binding FadR family transcriptional regulator|nr:FCD domain-containing protein [Acetobacteraceae bacterium]
MLRPLDRPRNRASEVVERLTAEIASGRLPPGARLPTEQEMMAAFEVSRSVVREAAAALRANGLVVTHQGKGAFVAADATRQPFRLDADLRDSLGDVVDVMELRLAIEVEAAALAAERASPPALRAVERALATFERGIARDRSSISEDFAFHSAIAGATGNPQFARILEYLGRFIIIPRQAIVMDPLRQVEAAAYLRTLVDEHRAIAAAIVARDPGGARAAMRDHLARSRERYRGMLRHGSA